MLSLSYLSFPQEQNRKVVVTCRGSVQDLHTKAEKVHQPGTGRLLMTLQCKCKKTICATFRTPVSSR